ncbi:MAG: hypothetical protein J7641_08540 [Cyanobacteria bacterium SID2]|nr:hypothetical protein [Cyanobacteria bacterium SID2]MBP0006581.1 hypothetical protein [Cyanobacteria bacterium SBC]
MNRSQLLSALLVSAIAVGGLQACSGEQEERVTAEPPAEEGVTEVTDAPADSTDADLPWNDSDESEVSTSDAEASDESRPWQNSLEEFDEANARLLTDTAKFLAGTTVDKDSSIVAQQQTGVWNDHAAYLDSAWQQLEAQQLSRARAWAETELKPLNDVTPALFYPFSGPDFLYAYTFFPKATDYVLVGLEPVGRVPNFENLSEGEVQQKLNEVSQSLYAILQYSFFRTNSMAQDLQQQGVLPILMVFMARTNQQLLDVQYVGLDESANLQVVKEGEAEAQGLIPGVKVTFVPEGRTVPKTLYYFSTDLSDDGLVETPEFLKFVGTFDRPVTYLKAASYLMHNDYFSQVRDLILTNSQAVLQDDSGIPVRFFDEASWDRQFYGSYVSPIELFAERYQSDLRAIYTSDSTITPLDFGIGYKYYNDSNLMLATPK